VTSRTLALALVTAMGWHVAAQQPPPQAVDVTTIGPQAGQKAIEFRLPDQDGRQQTLASVAGPKGTMLVFFRSADW